MRNQDSLMNDVRHALGEAEAEGFQRGFRAGLLEVEKVIKVITAARAEAAQKPVITEELCPVCLHGKSDHGVNLSGHLGCIRAGCSCSMRWQEKAQSGPQDVGQTNAQTYNHTRGDSPLTPCAICNLGPSQTLPKHVHVRACYSVMPVCGK